MNALESALRGVAGDLSRAGHAWALVGGFAVSARSEPRFTSDVDVAVAVADDVGAESLTRDLLGRGYRLLASVEQDATNRLATVRLTRHGDDGPVVVDLLFASSGIEPEIAAMAEPIEILPGFVVPLARTGHLIAVKLLARDDETRPHDLADLRALLRVASDGDLADARDAVRLIEDRGFDRGRDLGGALSEWEARRRPS